jgi:hypothetical protein
LKSLYILGCHLRAAESTIPHDPIEVESECYAANSLDSRSARRIHAPDARRPHGMIEMWSSTMRAWHDGGSQRSKPRTGELMAPLGVPMLHADAPMAHGNRCMGRAETLNPMLMVGASEME